MKISIFSIFRVIFLTKVDYSCRAAFAFLQNITEEELRILDLNQCIDMCSYMKNPYYCVKRKKNLRRVLIKEFMFLRISYRYYSIRILCRFIQFKQFECKTCTIFNTSSFKELYNMSLASLSFEISQNF